VSRSHSAARTLRKLPSKTDCDAVGERRRNPDLEPARKLIQVNFERLN
jgi:hypothetical protein